MNNSLGEVLDLVTRGRHLVVQDAVKACLDQGIAPEVILEEGLIAAMQRIGERFKKDEIYLPEVMIAARAMNAGLEVLDPILGSGKRRPKGSVLLATVRNDLHDVGKNIVSIMFRGAGFEVIDLGIDVPEERVLEDIKEHHPDIVGLSALLSTTLPMMKGTVDAIRQANLDEALIIMVGGAPVTERFAREIGADGYAPDGASAVDQALELMLRHGKPAS